MKCTDRVNTVGKSLIVRDVLSTGDYYPSGKIEGITSLVKKTYFQSRLYISRNLCCFFELYARYFFELYARYFFEVANFINFRENQYFLNCNWYNSSSVATLNKVTWRSFFFVFSFAMTLTAFYMTVHLTPLDGKSAKNRIEQFDLSKPFKLI